MRKVLFISLGYLCTLLAIVGIVVPLLPTTPLLLAALFFFSRYSERLKRMILHNRVLSKYVVPFIKKQPIPVSQKIRSIAVLWTALIISAMFLLDMWLVLLLLLVIGIGVSIHIARLR